jgi:D-alanine-D-alanine ligase
VCASGKALIARIEALREQLPGRPLLIQEYLTGGEFSVGLIIGFNEETQSLEWRELPPIQVDWSGLPTELPKILGFESKWDPESAYWTSLKYALFVNCMCGAQS